MSSTTQLEMVTFDDHLISEAKPVSICTVRLQTNSWKDTRGLHTKRSLLFLRRQCVGYNLLDEEADNIGATEVISRIINLNECPDGVYHAVVCNELRDWESGYIEDYDYELIPVSGS